MRGLAGRPGPLLPQLKIRFDKTAVQKDDARQSFSCVRNGRAAPSQPKFSPDMKAKELLETIQSNAIKCFDYMKENNAIL